MIYKNWHKCSGRYWASITLCTVIMSLLGLNTAHATSTPLSYEQICTLNDGKYPYSLTIPWRNKTPTESLTGIVKQSKKVYALEEQSVLEVSCENHSIRRTFLDSWNTKITEILNKHLIIETKAGWSILNISDWWVRHLSRERIWADERIRQYQRHYIPSFRITRVTSDGVYIQVTRTQWVKYEYGKKSFFFWDMTKSNSK